MEAKGRVKEVEKFLDSQLWHACAGGMVQMPAVSSKVFYFPQGHSEHACGPVDLRNFPCVPPSIICRVSAVKFMADPETDEVYAKMKLVPIPGGERVLEEEEGVVDGGEGQENKPASFAKTLTQSDANNGGGFSVPRYCAETIFPRLDYSADPPVQTILAKDVHGETWKFRHIYRGTPRRHLLTTGWSTFVNQKKLVAGDSIVFLRAENGDLCFGIRRARRGTGFGPDSSWNPAGGNFVMPFGGFSSFLSNGNEEGLLGKGKDKEKVKGTVTPESVIEAAALAASGQPFEVVYYPRASAPEFCVKASLVKEALRIRWCSGMRFKMAFETEDSYRISWFMGTISSVQVADPLHWPDSPWRLLQVTWDEPDLLQNVKCVSPWLVELVPNMPAIHLSPFSSPMKKLRLPQHPDTPLDSQFQVPTFSGNFFGCLSHNMPGGMQGARHDHYGLSLSSTHLNKLQTGLLPASFPPLLDHAAIHNRTSNAPITQKSSMSENVSCILTMAHSSQTSKKTDDVKMNHIVLFGQTILIEQQISAVRNSPSEENLDRMTKFSNGFGSALHQQSLQRRLSCDGFQWYMDKNQEDEPSLETGQCKVFMESEDVGRILDLSFLRSYEELCRKAADMFGIENSDILNNVIYRDVTGAVKRIGDEPFSDFIKKTRKLTILMDSSNDNVGLKMKK